MPLVASIPVSAPATATNAAALAGIQGDPAELNVAEILLGDGVKLSEVAEEAFRYQAAKSEAQLKKDIQSYYGYTPKSFAYALKAEAYSVQQRGPDVFLAQVSLIDDKKNEHSFSSCYVDSAGRPKAWTLGEIHAALSTPHAYSIVNGGPSSDALAEPELNAIASTTTLGPIEIWSKVDLIVTSSNKVFLRSELNAGDAPSYTYLGTMAIDHTVAPSEADVFAMKRANKYI